MSKKNETNKVYITDISVTGLFGMYDYTFSNLSTIPEFENFITILGNNGSGKTTILRIIAALLSSKPYDGSKSLLANTKFISFEIYLSSGVSIQASRKTELGPYTIHLRDSEGEFFNEIYFNAEIDQNDISLYVATRENDEEYFEFLNLIQSLKANISFISHERKVINSFGERLEYDTVLSDTLNDTFDDENVSNDNVFKRLIKEKSEIENWIKIEIQESANIGITNSNQVYLSLMKLIKSENEISVEMVINELKEVTRRLVVISKYGLMPEIKIKPFVDEIITLDSESENAKATLKTIFYYFKSISEKIDALEQIVGIIDTFVSSINNFLEDKELHFSVTSGFTILLKNGTRLKLKDLSSGEIQILLILLSALKSNIKGNANIIIIDEPEISLNSTWQRYLLNSFTKIAQTSPVQFIIATHSVEMISANYDNVVNLSYKVHENRD